MRTESRTNRRQLVWVFLAALIVRAVFCFVAIPLLHLNIGPNRSDFFTSTDGYIDLAVNLVDHGVYAFAADAPPTSYRGPAYPAVLAIAYAIVGDAARAILIVNCLASSAACVVIFLLARRLFAERVTPAWAAPIVLFPLSIYYCANSFSDTFLTLTIALYLWGLIALMRTPRWPQSLGTAAAFALTALTKAVILPMAPLVCVFAAVRNRRALPQSIVAMTLGVAFVGVWTLRNYNATGAFTPVSGGGGFNLLLGNFMIDRGGDCDASLKYARNAAVDYLREHDSIAIDLGALDTDGHLDVPRTIDQTYGRAAIGMFRENPTLLFRKIAINSARFWYFSSSPMKSLGNGVVNIATLLLALVGWRELHRRETASAELIAILVLAFMLLYAVVIVHSSRFSLPIVMALLPLATAPIASMYRALVGKSNREPNEPPGISNHALSGAKS
ncbi:MAG TPA: glycosyltransferase family 39 protein [Phycisphaerae bacterium]|nr:glycosyltransferase family 39 protein [Phycisphaerae bacterium]HRW53566.1 glycosyltransferase family 39 protein [Phycisphaerae bacterium]